jgi:hypothetical protein
MASSKAKPTVEAIVPEAAAPLSIADFGDDAGAGFGSLTKDDIKTPFIKLLQSGSPEVANNNPDGARPGQFYNTATGELLSGEPGLFVLPIGKVHHFVEWRPRDGGGGFVAEHQPTSPFVKATIQHNKGKRYGKLITPAGNELIETHSMFVMLLDETGKMPTGDAAIFPFTSTKIDACRTWYTKMMTTKVKDAPMGSTTGRRKGPPIYSFRTRISAFKDPRTAKGVFYNVLCNPYVEGSWYDSIVRPAVERDLLETAKGFYEVFVSGALRPDYENLNNTEDGTAEGSEPAQKEVAPF